jgi:hypothetical protein
MREEDLQRIERGDPTSPVELAIGLGFFVGLVGLLLFIVFGVLL